MWALLNTMWALFGHFMRKVGIPTLPPCHTPFGTLFAGDFIGKLFPF
tara:strand:+ start:715 stop:855 length:141 start_codon:yes stop_codon:yes gene_type:complete